MTSEKIKLRLETLRNDVCVNQDILDKIVNRLSTGSISESQALRQFRRLENQSIFLSPEDLEDEWEILSKAIDEAEGRANKLASSQFLLGLTALPIFVVLVLLSFPFGWFHGEGASVVASVFAGCLAAIVTHSFFVLRIHQQASLAAERLSEKRVAILFLRIALSRERSEDSERLLEFGTKMFLGHHVASTIPLQSEDYTASKKE